MAQKKIGRYEILSELGRGGMGTVYLAYDPTLEREVAIKLLPSYFAQDPEFSSRFAREAKTVAGLDHQAIVAVYDYGEDDVWPYFVMRYMRGGSLKDRLDEGPTDLSEAYKIITRVAGALDKAHSTGVVHRDLKPGNILYDGEGQAYLGDFGIVHLAETSESFTRSGNTLGTPAYMSPEQVDALPDLDGRSDIYSLGVVLYEMLTGEPPYQNDSAPRLMMMHLVAPIPDLLEARPDLPAAMQNIINKAMAKDRDERYQTAGDMADAVQEIIGATARQSPPAKPADAGTAATGATLQPAAESPPPTAKPAGSWRIGKWIAAVVSLFIFIVVVSGIIYALTRDEGDGSVSTRTVGGLDETGGESAVEKPPVTAVPLASEEPPATAVPTSSETCAHDTLLCVGLVTDVGDIDDKSFNQSAWEGVQQAAQLLGAQVDFIETADVIDYANNISMFAEEDYDVIVTVGFAMGEATAEAAAEYPEIDFIGVDQFQDFPTDNVAALIFPEDEVGFAAGALAALLTSSGTIAGVYGTDLVPPVVAFKEGFEAGAAFIDPNVEVISTYYPGGLDVAFTDPEWGASTAREAIELGADVIFGAGGLTGNAALVEAAGEEGLFCIGVDTDQWETIPEARPCLVSSAIKDISAGVFSLIQASQEGAFPSGDVAGAARLAPYHQFDAVIDPTIKSMMAGIEAGLADGSISTGVQY